jgi:GNAT superfamily N-acetyltransferase
MTEALTTGWEPDLPPYDSLLRQFVYGYADPTADMARTLGGRVDRDADASLADLGSPFLFDNAVVLLRPPDRDGLAAVLDHAAAFYPPERAWVLLSVFPIPDPGAARRGLTLIGHPPLMLRPPGGTPPAVPPAELRILPVTTPIDLSVFRRVLVDGYPLDDGQAGAIADPRLLGGALHLFIGYAAGAPVAVSGAAINHGVVEVDWVTTVPAARGRGYGTALTWRAMQVAPTLPAMLTASDPGQPVYEAMGFLRLLRATMWGRLAGPAPAGPAPAGPGPAGSGPEESG